MSLLTPTLGNLVDRLSDIGEDEFRRTYLGWAFVGPPAEALQGDWTFRTGSVRTVRAGEGSKIILLEEGFLVHYLRKAQDGPFKDTILVGRVATNDVVIPHEAVSKLHARVKHSADGEVLVFDAGSSNGTFVNDNRLIPDKAQQISAGDIITLGSLSYHVFDGERLFDAVRRLRDV